MSNRITTGTIQGSRAAMRNIQRRKLTKLLLLQQQQANVQTSFSFKPSASAAAATSSLNRTGKLCPRCKTSALPLDSKQHAICSNCQRETNALTPKKIYDNLSRFVVGQDAVKQVLAVSMFAHNQRVRANDALLHQNQPSTTATASSVLDDQEGGEGYESDKEAFLDAEAKLKQEIQDRALRKKRKARFDLLLTGEFTQTDREELREVYRDHPLELKRELASLERFNQLSLTEQAQWLQELIVEQPQPPTPQQQPQPQPVREYEQRLALIQDLNVKRFDKSNVLLLGSTGTGKTLLAKTLAEVMKVPIVICDATSLTAAGYVGDDVESVLYKLMDACNWEVGRAERGVVFLDEVDKIARKYLGGSRSKDVGGESVQMGLLKMLEGTKVTLSKKTGQQQQAVNVVLDTSNILFVCSGAFEGIDALVAKRTSSRSLGFAAPTVAKRYEEETTGAGGQDARNRLFAQVEPADLIEFGMIPEFVGRFAAITSTAFLTEEDLMRILVEPENSVVNQMRGLFKLSFHNAVELEFTPGALRSIARMALQRKSGARGLKLILDNILRETTYDLPDKPWVTHVVVDEEHRCLLMTAREYEVWKDLQSGNNSSSSSGATAGEEERKKLNL